MNRPMPSSWSPPSGSLGFSLVEVTVAIGIFAFVAVGILGLLPAALKIRSDSAQETRAVMIAQELLSSIKSGDSVLKVNQFRDGPGLSHSQSFWPPENLTEGPVVLGYVAGTTVPFFAAAQKSRTTYKADALWKGDSFPSAARDNNIDVWAKLDAQRMAPNLYRVTVQVRSPASAKLINSTVTTFTTCMSGP